MYIHIHNLSDSQAPPATKLIDDLKKYIAENGQSRVEDRIEEERQRLGRAIVIIAENHSASTRTVDLVRRLMKSDVYRFIASEHFLNAGQFRTEVRDFMRGRRKLLGHFLCPYESLLQDFKQKPKYMLFMGSRTGSSLVRDRRLALHFMEEVTDRKLSRATPGILVCGRTHGARVAAEDEPKTMRRWLEEAGFKMLSLMIATDDIDGATLLHHNKQFRTDTVWPVDETQTESNAIRLLDLVPISSEYLVVPTKDSPFEHVTNVWNGFSSISMAERYEMVILAKSMQRCHRS